MRLVLHLVLSLLLHSLHTKLVKVCLSLMNLFGTLNQLKLRQVCLVSFPWMSELELLLFHLCSLSFDTISHLGIHVCVMMIVLVAVEFAPEDVVIISHDNSVM